MSPKAKNGRFAGQGVESLRTVSVVPPVDEPVLGRAGGISTG